ncbi:MAG: hypothetical protein ACXVZV_02630 [Terriglobales bacterium]
MPVAFPARGSHDWIAAMIPDMAKFLGWPAYALVGAMSSAGSGFWNHILDAVRAMKIEKEAKAQLQVQALVGSVQEIRHRCLGSGHQWFAHVHRWGAISVHFRARGPGVI